jgi:antitoxin VapB
MALSIKSEEADRLARELAAATGETLTDAVTNALRERLERIRSNSQFDIADRLDRLRIEYSSHPLVDSRTADEIIGYDEYGLPT